MARAAARGYAALLLIVYLSVAVGSHAVALGCGCVMRHDGAACAVVTDGCRHDCCAGVPERPAYRGERCCNHDHSTAIDLYTQSRQGADLFLRLSSLPTLFVTPCWRWAGDCGHVRFDYGCYLPPPLSGAYCAQPSLRAPPAAV